MVDLADNVVAGMTKDFLFQLLLKACSRLTVTTTEKHCNRWLFGDWNGVDKQSNTISSAQSEHINLEQYAATESNEKYFMYLNVRGNILNGISVPSYSAKSVPEMNERDFNQGYEPVSVSNQKSAPLPVLTGEDTVYILVDTDDATGYSSLGTSLGADRMLKLRHKWNYNPRVLREWTGAETNDWMWSKRLQTLQQLARNGTKFQAELLDTLLPGQRRKSPVILVL